MKNRNIIEMRTLRGFKLVAFEGDSITKEVQKKGEYDTNTLNSLSEVLDKIKPDTSLDIGANIGNHALLIARLSKKVIAFEPIKFIFNVLESNVANNNIQNISVENVGLSNIEDQQTIYIPNNSNLGSSSLEKADDGSEKLGIKTVVGDDYLHMHYLGSQVDFIKIDVEGHEAMALIGLRQTLLRCKPLVLIEWKSPHTLSQFKQLNLFKELFPDYKKYGLSYTTNKKVYRESYVGYLKRLYHKLIGSKWCLTDFDESKMYSNVYFVPPRFQQYFADKAKLKYSLKNNS